MPETSFLKKIGPANSRSSIWKWNYRVKLRKWKVNFGLPLAPETGQISRHTLAMDSFMDSGPHTSTPTLDPPVSPGNFENISVQVERLLGTKK